MAAAAAVEKEAPGQEEHEHTDQAQESAAVPSPRVSPSEPADAEAREHALKAQEARELAEEEECRRRWCDISLNSLRSMGGRLVAAPGNDARGVKGGGRDSIAE